MGCERTQETTCSSAYTSDPDADADEGNRGLRNGVSTHQHASSFACAGHSQLAHTHGPAVTLPGLSCLLFLRPQAATRLPNGDGVSSPITPSTM